MEIEGDNVICPYCKNICGDHENFEDCGWNDCTEEFECEECGKKFKGERVVTVDYRSQKDCSLNGEKHIKGKYHCEKCDIYNPCMEEGSFA